MVERRKGEREWTAGTGLDGVWRAWSDGVLGLSFGVWLWW